MSIFASRTPESMNTDPEPWALRHYDGDVRPRGWEECQKRPEWHDRENSLDYLPRPEFTPKTTHPANPALVEFRYLWSGQPDMLDIADYWVAEQLESDGENAPMHDYTPEQVDHARRVLSRLAHLTKEQNA